MNESPVQAVESHSASPNLMRHADNLKEGSPVLVRIISAKGGKNYEASVAGARIILQSDKSLKAGDTFIGKVGIRNGTITINPNNSSTTLNIKEIFTSTNIETGGLYNQVSSPAIASLLAGLNLPADNFSFRILQQFKQLGLKLDAETMQKIRKAAAKSKNPERKLEELANKLQKKVEFDEDSSLPLELLSSDITEDDQNQKKENNSSQTTTTDGFTSADWLTEIKKFLQTITEGSLSNEAGKLTILNHLGFFKDRHTENSWITIPFEIVNPFEETTTGNGKILILLNAGDKSFRQMNIHADFKNDRYRFAVFSKPGSREINRIIFSQQGNGNNENITDRIKEEFMKSGKTVTVETVPFEKTEGFACGLETFTSVEGSL